jgi:hypothetical protein
MGRNLHLLCGLGCTQEDGDGVPRDARPCRAIGRWEHGISGIRDDDPRSAGVVRRTGRGNDGHGEASLYTDFSDRGVAPEFMRLSHPLPMKVLSAQGVRSRQSASNASD